MPQAPPHFKHKESDPTSTFGETVWSDLSREDVGQTIQQDLRDVYQFYIDRESRDQLDDMGPGARGFYAAFWLLKNSILRLTPARRLLLLGSVLLFTNGFFGPTSFFIFGFALLLVVLLLELKDKLLAQDELDTGRAVQFALMPSEQPTLPGWEAWLYTRPANDVGGDLIDALELKRGRLGLALGDVAGKGLGAALVMAKLQSTLRAIAPSFGTLRALGASTNAIFCRDGLPNRFISLIYLIASENDGAVRLLNAGHLPPLHLTADGVDTLPKGGPALGLTGKARYDEQKVMLEVGDYLLVFSDGLTEARDEQGAFFGDRRLRALLPHLYGLTAEAFGAKLVRAVDRFAGTARPHDDLSLIVLRRTGSPSADRPADEVEPQHRAPLQLPQGRPS